MTDKNMQQETHPYDADDIWAHQPTPAASLPEPPKDEDPLLWVAPKKTRQDRPKSAQKSKYDSPKLVDPPLAAGRVPPHDLDAEAAVLSALLLDFDGDIHPQVSEYLKPEHFYSEANARIYQCIQALIIDKISLDIVSVAAWLRSRDWLQKMGGTAYLAQLADATPVIGNIRIHAKIVFDKWRIRQVIATAHRIAAEGYGDIGDVQEWLNGAASAVAEMAGIGVEVQGEGTKTLASKFLNSLDEKTANILAGGEPEGTRTGMPGLDRVLGILRPGLNVVGAWSGVGKSSLSRKWAYNQAKRTIKRRGVVIFAAEMTRQDTFDALATMVAEVDSSKLDRGEIYTQDEMDRLVAAANELSQLPIWIEDSESMPDNTPRAVETVLRKKKVEWAQEGIETAAAYLDYLQLFKPDEAQKNREQDISNVAYAFHSTGQRLGIPMIALSQLNEEGKKRSDGKPCAEDARESKGVVQAASTVVLIHNQEYMDRRRVVAGTAASRMENVELIVDKGRKGPVGIIESKFLPYCTAFKDLSEVVQETPPARNAEDAIEQLPPDAYAEQMDDNYA